MGRKLPYKLQSGRPFTHFYSFFWLWSTGLYSCLTTWVTHFPKLSNPPNRSFLPILLWVELFNILFHFQTIPPTYCRGDGPTLGARVAALQPLPHPLRLRAEAGDSASGRGGALQAAQPQRGAGPRDHQQVLVASFTFYLLIFLLRNPVPIDKVSTTEEGLEACSVGGKKTELEQISTNWI